MEIANTIFNILIVGGIMAYWIFAFAILYHLTRFGIGTQPKRFAAIFLAGSVFLTSAYVILFSTLDLTRLAALIQ